MDRAFLFPEKLGLAAVLGFVLLPVFFVLLVMLAALVMFLVLLVFVLMPAGVLSRFWCGICWRCHGAKHKPE